LGLVVTLNDEVTPCYCLLQDYVGRGEVVHLDHSSRVQRRGGWNREMEDGTDWPEKSEPR